MSLLLPFLWPPWFPKDGEFTVSSEIEQQQQKKRVSNGFSLNFWSTSHFFLAKLYRQGTKGSQCEASIG